MGSSALTAFAMAAVTAAAVVGAGTAGPPRGVVETCATRSEAGFPDAYSSPRNLVVGPLVLMGGAAYTPPETVRDVGGQKYPVLVRNGSRVTMELPRRARRLAGLAYGPLPQGEIGVSDAHRVVTFIACARGSASGSTAGGRPVTFWSGFIVASRPACVPLRIWADGARSPRTAVVRLGVRQCG